MVITYKVLSVLESTHFKLVQYFLYLLVYNTLLIWYIFICYQGQTQKNIFGGEGRGLKKCN